MMTSEASPSHLWRWMVEVRLEQVEVRVHQPENLSSSFAAVSQSLAVSPRAGDLRRCRGCCNDSVPLLQFEQHRLNALGRCSSMRSCPHSDLYCRDDAHVSSVSCSRCPCSPSAACSFWSLPKRRRLRGERTELKRVPGEVDSSLTVSAPFAVIARDHYFPKGVSAGQGHS